MSCVVHPGDTIDLACYALNSPFRSAVLVEMLITTKCRLIDLPQNPFRPMDKPRDDATPSVIHVYRRIVWEEDRLYLFNVPNAGFTQCCASSSSVSPSS
jgi:hypothetical protein